MTNIRQHAQEYLAMRRALGFKLTRFGELLLSFVGYLEEHGAGAITTEAAVAWATSTPRSSASREYWSHRLLVVRVFARHLTIVDPIHEVPPTDILPCHNSRVSPHLYTPGEIAALLAAANALHPPLRGLTYRTLISLLAVTGLRTGEACQLDRADVDFDSRVLTIRDTKFGKSRQIPVHDSTVTALRVYDQTRDRLCPKATTPAFLVSTRGTRLGKGHIAHTFAGLLDAAGIHMPHGQRRPRLHDLRHLFAVTTLLTWYHDGVDVQARMPVLSTFLGHADPKSTYWYLSGSPELLALAAARLEQAFGGQP
jgi:integrase/recombinase XerD